MTDIPAGYQIHFITWENDADAYCTEIWSGIQNEQDVLFLLHLAEQFRSVNNSQNGLGNGGVDAETLVNRIEKTLEKFPAISDDMRMLFEQERSEASDGDDEDSEGNLLADRWYDLLTDRMLSTPVEQYCQDETRFCRVFDKAKVYYYAQPVQDVSVRFV
jgi:hypothetical protein